MKINTTFFFGAGLALLSIFFLSCNKAGHEYPFAIEYKELSFENTSWHVLTNDSYTGIGEPPNMTSFDDSLKATLLSEESLPPFRRLEFLTDSTVVVTFKDGNISFDTIMPYLIDQNLIKILFGSLPGEEVVLQDRGVPNSLVLGVVSALYSFKQANGEIDYSPFVIQYSNERDVSEIISGLRTQYDLMPNDTVAVNKSVYVFK